MPKLTLMKQFIQGESYVMMSSWRIFESIIYNYEIELLRHSHFFYFSPEQLKHKIIIKGKKLKNSSISEDLVSDVGEVSDEDEAAESAHMMDLEQSLSEDSKSDSTKQKKKKKNVSLW